jgi:single-strand DNA-binding protein
MNRVILLGRIGKIENRGNFTKISLVTTARRNNEEVAQWHDLICFGKSAEILEKYTEKGCKLLIEGSLSYNLKDKVKYTNIIIEKFEIVEWKKTKDDDLTSVSDYQTDDDIPF